MCYSGIQLYYEEFLHFIGRERVKELVHNRMRNIVLATLNIGILTVKTMESVDIMRRRKIDICCFQMTKWRRGRTKELGVKTIIFRCT